MVLSFKFDNFNLEVSNLAEYTMCTNKQHTVSCLIHGINFETSQMTKLLNDNEEPKFIFLTIIYEKKPQAKQTEVWDLPEAHIEEFHMLFPLAKADRSEG